jgi:hypothetical protein
VIKRQLSRTRPDSVGDRHSASRKINRCDFPTQNGYMPKQLAKGIANVGGLEIAGCHFVKHRSKQREVISADEGYLDIRTFRRHAIEVFCDLYAGESAPQDNDLSFSGFPIDFIHHAHIPQVRKFVVPFRQLSHPRLRTTNVLFNPRLHLPGCGG